MLQLRVLNSGTRPTSRPFLSMVGNFNSVGLQLFQGRLSEKVYATIRKGIVGGFEFLFQGNLKRKTQEVKDVCLRLLKESSKGRFDSDSVRNSVWIYLFHITFRDCRLHIFSDNLSRRNSCMYWEQKSSLSRTRSVRTAHPISDHLATLHLYHSY